VFIPTREPWRNGIIEHFNDTFDWRFLRHERFAGLGQLSERTSKFERSTTLSTATAPPRRSAPHETPPSVAASWPEHDELLDALISRLAWIEAVPRPM
jgi:hypothetical protein